MHALSLQVSFGDVLLAECVAQQGPWSMAGPYLGELLTTDASTMESPHPFSSSSSSSGIRAQPDRADNLNGRKAAAPNTRRKEPNGHGTIAIMR